MRRPTFGPRRIANSVTPLLVIPPCSPFRGSSVSVVTGAPAEVTLADGSALKVTWLFVSVNVPSRFAARSGRRISDDGSLPPVLGASRRCARSVLLPRGVRAAAQREAPLPRDPAVRTRQLLEPVLAVLVDLGT